MKKPSNLKLRCYEVQLLDHNIKIIDTYKAVTYMLDIPKGNPFPDDGSGVFKNFGRVSWSRVNGGYTQDELTMANGWSAVGAVRQVHRQVA